MFNYQSFPLHLTGHLLGVGVNAVLLDIFSKISWGPFLFRIFFHIYFKARIVRASLTVAHIKWFFFSISEEKSSH